MAFKYIKWASENPSSSQIPDTLISSASTNIDVVTSVLGSLSGVKWSDDGTALVSAEITDGPFDSNQAESIANDLLAIRNVMQKYLPPSTSLSNECFSPNLNMSPSVSGAKVRVFQCNPPYILEVDQGTKAGGWRLFTRKSNGSFIINSQGLSNLLTRSTYTCIAP